MRPIYSFLLAWLYSVSGLNSFHVPLLAFSCSSFRGVEGLFAGFVQYVLGGLLIVTSLVVGFLGYTLELFCNVCNLPVMTIYGQSKLLLFIHGSVVWIGLLWPVRQL